MSCNALEHIGVARRSGRYPWGSGDRPFQSSEHFESFYQSLIDSGMNKTQAANAMGFTTTELRAYRTIAKNEQRAERRAMAIRLMDKGYSRSEIGRRMGINESSVRSLLDDTLAERNDRVTLTANLLKAELKKNPYLDVGEGIGLRLGVSDTMMKTALVMLEAEGYEVYNHKSRALGTGYQINNKTLVPPGTDISDFMANRDKIAVPKGYIDLEDKVVRPITKPISIDSSTIQMVYGEEGGLRDGLIEIRPGVREVSIGNSNYAQIRALVDDTHYMKGMAVYSNDLPEGVNVRIHTPKNDTGNVLDNLKPIKSDPDNPFKAVTRQLYSKDENGNEVQSSMNIIYAEGEWNDWSSTLSSQMLSKQSWRLADEQLGIALDRKKAELADIRALTNDTVKRSMLKDFAESCDADAVDLKAAGMPGQRTQVLLPVPEMAPNEIYAPNYKNGEKVALVRHPHGGIFEIPVLKVNNRNPVARDILGSAKDAVAINPSVAKQLSGADFDGDTVLVIPDPHNRVATSKPLQGLKDFDAHNMYKGYEGMKKLEGKALQNEMGRISNLITDMTIRGANDRSSESEIAAAIRHSMVVIDAEKHNLNYKQSYLDNGIANLKKKYQTGGASTLISRASAEVRVPEYKLRSAADGGPYDRNTGALVKVRTGATQRKFDPLKNEWTTTDIPKTTKSKVMAETSDARTISSGSRIENVYADFANSLKKLANDARRDYLTTPNAPYSPSAAKTYVAEVTSLNDKLTRVTLNKPLERQAQNVAGALVRARVADNPDMSPDDRKKLRTKALNDARLLTGAVRTTFDVTPREWEAIQAGAISSSKLTQIMMKGDGDQIKGYATPKNRPVLTDALAARARSMQTNGYTQTEIAEALGVSTSTINEALK